MNLNTFLNENIIKSTGLQYTTETRYAYHSIGFLNTGTRDNIYDVSVYNIQQMYQWKVGKYISLRYVYDTLISLGYSIVYGLPLTKTGVYATWKNKPVALLLL